ncbi:MAG: hypothetical protein M0020_06270 [Actinomycetota bacterium]|nr:hypothetical protein [Actinomycetota bacterium]
MGYVDAGYTIALGVIAVYGALLWRRARRLGIRRRLGPWRGGGTQP